MKSLKIGHRIAIIPLILSTLMLIVGLTGFNGMRSMGYAMNSIYFDRVVPLRDLKVISDAYAVTIVDTAHKVRGGSLSTEAGLKNLSDAEKIIRERWTAYSSTQMTADEKKLATQVESRFRAAEAVSADLRRLFAARDGAALASFNDKTLYPQIEPLTEAISALIDVQLRIAQQDHEVAEAEFRSLTWAVSLTILIAALIGAVSAWWLASGITGPLKAMTQAMMQLAQGRLDILIPVSRFRDEVQDMSGAMSIFRENAVERQRLQQEELRAAEQRAERARTIERITNSFDSGVSGVLLTVSHAAEEMNATAVTLSGSAEEASAQATTVAAAAEEAATNVQTVSAAAEELHASISEISRQMTVAKTIAHNADEESRRVTGTMEELAETAGRISQVVTLINSIAAQTNLLALNATIEAARAGEAGKGFAVVAGEVKNLATQTAKATEEIAQQVTGVQNTTGRAVSAIDNIARTISNISEIATAIAAAVEQQGAATREISDNVSQVAQATSEVTQNIQGVNSAARDTSAAAGEVRQASGELSEQAATLRGLVQNFLSDVRAA